MITLKKGDNVGSTKTIREQVSFMRLTQSGKGVVIPGFIDSNVVKAFPDPYTQEFQLTVTGLQNQEKCRIVGSFLINKVI